MQHFRRLYGWILVFCFGGALLVGTLPHAWLTILISRMYGESDTTRRQHFGRLHMFWGLFTWHFIRITTRMRVTIVHSCTKRDKRYIVIANHRTALDHPIVNYCAHAADVRDLRWVQKARMRKVPVIGWVSELEGDAFLSRHQDPHDIARIKDTAKRAVLDNASVIIYPEGTRFRGMPLEDSPYRHVHAPKIKGFKTLVESMPDTPILSVMLDWGELEGGRTLDDIGALLCRQVNVSVTAFPPIRPDQAEEFLIARWREHDHNIAGRRASVSADAIS